VEDEPGGLHAGVAGEASGRGRRGGLVSKAGSHIRCGNSQPEHAVCKDCGAEADVPRDGWRYVWALGGLDGDDFGGDPERDGWRCPACVEIWAAWDEAPERQGVN
jgi:hypothetical protein